MHRLTMVLSATLLAMSPVAAQAASTNAVALAQKKAAIIGSLHKKAKKALVNAAQDKSFEAFLGASDESHRHAAKKRVDEVSLNVQSRFHVEEMCLIDASGPELARIVGNKIADDLSPDESEAIFFGPSFAQRPRTVFVSPLYMSPDAHKWVLAYTTPVLVSGEKKAILHYEHGLDVYQKALAKGLSGAETFVVAVNEEGWVIADSRGAPAVAKRGDSETPESYFARFELGGQSLEQVVAALNAGESVSDGNGRRYEGAQRKVERWTVLAFSVQ